MRALVTGAGGFVGRYLVDFLLEKGYAVCGTYHRERPAKSDFDRCRMERLDIKDKESLRGILVDFHPDEIYHLAAVAVTTGQNRDMYYQVNFFGSINLFEAVKEALPRARVLFVGSANAYGPVPAERQPIRESETFYPVNHYAASKAAADMAACAYAAEGLHVVRARPFNHTGPGQTVDYVCSRLARQAAEISLNMREPLIEAGNLEAARDFTDVRDVVRAYWLLLQKGRPGEAYNVCSQKAYSVREIVALLAEVAGVEIQVRSRLDLLRKADISLLIGSREKLFNEVGWEPGIPFKETLKDLLAWWRKILNGRNVQ
ncbi:MAG: NAD-dependent epimerase/dehydratase family protein [Pelotomaculum sp.]|nr:NAD-dependent epimerase/dehydratase family protein [Pelotomaculum sp.]